MAWVKLKNGNVKEVTNEELVALARGGHAVEVDPPKARSLAETEINAPAKAGPRREYSAFKPGAKSQYNTDEARASAYVQSLTAQGIKPSPIEHAFPRASSVARSGMPGLSRFANLAYAGLKDISSLPGRVLTSTVQQGIDYARRKPAAGNTFIRGMADPTGRAIGQANFVTDIARDPYLLPSLALTRGTSMLPRIGANLAFGLSRPMLERAADYSPETTWAPTTRELIEQSAMAIAPEGIGGLGYLLAKSARTSAKRMFMSQVKPPPALRKRQLWDAVDRFSDNPANLREVIGGRTSYPDLVEGWEVGNAARQARVEPIYDEMERRGVMIPVSRAIEGSESALSEYHPGQAHFAEMLSAQADLENLATQPAAKYFPFAKRGAKWAPYGEENLPGTIPQTAYFTPREARSFKSNAYGRVKDWNDPMSDIKSTSYEGAGRGLREALEAEDLTGTLGAKNREWGDWLGTEEAFERMRNRTTNNNPAKWWEFIKRSRENPQLVVKMLDAEQALRGSGQTALTVSPFTRSLMQEQFENGEME